MVASGSPIQSLCVLLNRAREAQVEIEVSVVEMEIPRSSPSLSESEKKNKFNVKTYFKIVNIQKNIVTFKNGELLLLIEKVH